MFWGLQNMESSLKILNYTLLFCIIGLTVAQFVLKQIQPLELLILLLVYLVLVWQRISIYTYRIILIISLVFVVRQCLNFINFCFGQQSDLLAKEKLGTMDDKTFKNIIILSALWILLMCYAMLLCWRAYERSKLYLMFTNQFILT